jgi:DNA-binding HxlR family transcriptional regulator
MPDTPADSIAFLLRHLGPQSDRDLLDSTGLHAATLRDTLAALEMSGRIERHGVNRWRLIPARPAPTGNPGTR